MDENDEYTLRHEFSPSLTEADEQCVSLLMEYILQRGNPFNVGKPKKYN